MPAPSSSVVSCHLRARRRRDHLASFLSSSPDQRELRHPPIRHKPTPRNQEARRDKQPTAPSSRLSHVTPCHATTQRRTPSSTRPRRQCPRARVIEHDRRRRRRRRGRYEEDGHGWSPRPVASPCRLVSLLASLCVSSGSEGTGWDRQHPLAWPGCFLAFVWCQPHLDLTTVRFFENEVLLTGPVNIHHVPH